jgi:hypothetical protein
MTKMSDQELFYEYGNLIKQSPIKFIEKLTTSPISSLNIIVWKPAKYALWFILTIFN